MGSRALRFIIIAAVAGFTAFVAWTPSPVVAQAGPNHFSFVLVNDVHYLNSGSGAAASQTSLASVVSWLKNSTNQSTWNIQGVFVQGDNTSDNKQSMIDGTVALDIQPVVDAYTDVHDAGIPIVYVDGNHDVNAGGAGVVPCAATGNQCSRDNWNNYFATPLTSWATAVADALWPTGSLGVQHAANVLKNIDVTVQGVTYPMGFAGMHYQGVAADLVQNAAWMNADPNRNFIWGTHMFLVDAATSSDGTIHPCAYGEGAYCTTAPGSNGLNDGVAMWNALKGLPNLSFIACGHYHNGMFATLTATDGHAVPAFGGRSTAYLNWGNIAIADFEPLTHTIDVYNWRTSTNVQDTTAMGGGKQTFPWTPLVASGSPSVTGGFKRTGRSLSSGRGVN